MLSVSQALSLLCGRCFADICVAQCLPLLLCELATTAATHFGENIYQSCIRESLHRAESIDVVLLLEDLHSCQVLSSSLALVRN